MIIKKIGYFFTAIILIFCNLTLFTQNYYANNENTVSTIPEQQNTTQTNFSTPLPKIEESSINNEREIEQQDTPLPYQSFNSTAAPRALLANEAIAYTYDELRTLVQDPNNGKTYIYLGEDILQLDRSITIQPNKASITIDGRNPNTGVIHTYREINVSNLNNHFILTTNPATAATVTFKNLTILGQNRDGIVDIYDSVRNATVIFENIDYNGPQMSLNRYGTTIFRNSRITINKDGYATVSQEIAEVWHVIFEGNNTANHQPLNDYTLFYFYQSQGSITFAKDSTLVASTNAGLISGGSVETGFDVTFEENAKATFTQTQERGLKSFFSSSGGQFKMNPGSSVILNRTFESTTNPAIRWNSNANTDFVINGGNIEINQDAATSVPVISIPYLTNDGGSLKINQNNTTTNYIVNFANAQTFKNFEFSVVLNGNSISTNSGIYHNGTLTIENSKISFIAKQQINNNIFKVNGLLNANNSEITLHAQNTVTNIAIGAFMDINGSNIINSTLTITADIISGQLFRTNNTFLNNNSTLKIYSNHINTDIHAVQFANNLSLIGTTLDVVINQTNMPNFAVVYVTSNFTVDSQSSLNIISNSGVLNTLLYVGGANITFDNPKKVLMHSGATFVRIIKTISNTLGQLTKFNFKGQQLNQKKDYIAYDSSNIESQLTPDYRFIKKNGQNIELSGEIYGGNAGYLLNIVTNEQPGDILTQSKTISFDSAIYRTFALGRIDITNFEAKQNDTKMTGITNQEIALKVSYTPTVGGAVTLNKNNLNNEFSFNVIGKISLNPVQYVAATSFLFTDEVVIEVTPQGILAFVSVPPTMSFGTQKISNSKQQIFLNTVQPDWKIEIRDDRNSTTNWTLKAKIAPPTDPNKKNLSNLLYFVDENGTKTKLSTTQDIIIAQDASADYYKTLQFSEGKGFVIEIDPGNAFIENDYQTDIQFTLEDTI